nr:TauD/TfdA family dioxygenase [Novosphingobium sp. SG751A]
MLDGREEALADLRDDITANFARGPGAILLRGLDPAALGEVRFASVLARIGGWLGTLAIQSPQGERVARVERRGDDPAARGTHSDLELRPHTDLHDILALGCFRAAATGGESLLLSARDLYGALLDEAPQHLPALAKGYYWSTNPALASRQRLRPRLPILFMPQSGRRAQVAFNGYFLRRAAHERGEDLSPVLAAAIECMEAVAGRLAARNLFDLMPGDMLFWHNWSWLHGRIPFADRAGHSRLLLRLWIRSALAPRADPGLLELGQRMDEDHRLTAQMGIEKP